MWIALVLAVVFSVIDEGTKPLVVGRHCDIEDILLNDVGAALGYVAARYIKLDERECESFSVNNINNNL